MLSLLYYMHIFYYIVSHCVPVCCSNMLMLRLAVISKMASVEKTILISLIFFLNVSASLAQGLFLKFMFVQNLSVKEW